MNPVTSTVERSSHISSRTINHVEMETDDQNILLIICCFLAFIHQISLVISWKLFLAITLLTEALTEM